MDAKPAEFKDLMYKNSNTMCGVDIELMHGKFASIVPVVHRQSSEKEAVNEACRSLAILGVATDHNRYAYDEMSCLLVYLYLMYLITSTTLQDVSQKSSRSRIYCQRQITCQCQQVYPSLSQHSSCQIKEMHA